MRFAARRTGYYRQITAAQRTKSFVRVFRHSFSRLRSVFRATQDITALIQGGRLGKYENGRNGTERNAVFVPGVGPKTLTVMQANDSDDSVFRATLIIGR